VISTFLVEARWLPITALVAFVVVAPIVGVLLARHRRVTVWLLAGSLLAVLLLTLLPDGTGRPGIACAVELPYLSVDSVESLANVLLLAPTALLVGLLLRRPAVGIAAGIVLSAVIEAVQALVPAIGRACDTSDLITNALGALLGGVLAWVALALADRRDARLRRA
jgi:MFS family permease